MQRIKIVIASNARKRITNKLQQQRTNNKEPTTKNQQQRTNNKEPTTSK
jgi:hypothetical protein